MTQQAAKSSFPIWLIILLLIPVGLFVLGVVGALGVYGINKYMMKAKATEGIEVSREIASGIARCAAERDQQAKRVVPTGVRLRRVRYERCAVLSIPMGAHESQQRHCSRPG